MGEANDTDESTHITLKVQGADGAEVHFRVRYTTPFGKLMNAYAERVVSVVGLVCLFSP